jgi:hypothetical protein
MEPDLKKAKNSLIHFELYPYPQIRASGRLNKDEIPDVTEAVPPKVPI